MPFFKTGDFSGYSVEFSPFEENKLACATSQNFGIIGNGRQFIFSVEGDQRLVEQASFFTRDGLYDCAWSEENEHFLISGSGDGSIKLWDIRAANQPPIRSFEEHNHEVYAVDWNLQTKDNFVSGSWDDSIRVWSPLKPRSMQTYREHR
jgi:peroxin-7